MLVTQNEQYFGIVYQASGRAEIEKEEGDVEVVYSQIMQYENEPLAEDKADNNRTDHIGEEANVHLALITHYYVTVFSLSCRIQNGPSHWDCLVNASTVFRFNLPFGSVSSGGNVKDAATTISSVR